MNPTLPPRQIISNLKLNISKSTVKRRIKSKGLSGFIAVKKPFINLRNRKRLFALAKELMLRPKRFWRRHLVGREEVRTNGM